MGTCNIAECSNRVTALLEYFDCMFATHICDQIYEKGSSTHIRFTNFDDSYLEIKGVMDLKCGQ